MVKRIFSFLNKEVGGLHEAAYLLGFFAILSQVLALFRDRLLAHYFGAEHSLDLYYAAFRIPDFIFVSIASIVSISVLIPFLMEKMDRDTEDASRFVRNLFSAFFLIISTVSIVVFFMVPWLNGLLFPKFSADQATLNHLTRILLLSPIFLGLSSFMASITQIYKRFFIYALSPVLYNLGIIFGIIVLYPLLGLSGLVLGVVFGAFLHFFIQVPFVWQTSLFPRFTFKINFSSIRKVLLLSIPRTLTISSNEISELFLISFASLLAGGSISIFTFAYNLQSVPLSIIGVSYSLAAFPTLTRLITSGNRPKFVEQMIISSKHIIFWSTPAMVLFIVLRAQVVRVILGSGRFNWTDTKLTAAAVALFAISIIPQSLILLFVRSYYSRGDTIKPLIMNAISATLMIFLSYFLAKSYFRFETFRYFIESLFKVDDLPGAAVLMLPLGFSIGVTFNMIIHWIFFHFDFKEYSKPVLLTLYQIFSASVLMGFVSYVLLNLLDNVFDINTFWGIFLQGFISGIIGIVVFVITLKLLKNRELSVIWKTLHGKIWKAKVIGPDPDLI